MPEVTSSDDLVSVPVEIPVPVPDENTTSVGTMVVSCPSGPVVTIAVPSLAVT